MKCNYKRHTNFSLSGHMMRQLVGVIGLQTHHVVGSNVERTHPKYGLDKQHVKSSKGVRDGQQSF